MGSQNSNDDCYFYFYSSCTKGDECPFRHCEAALGTETVCTLWKEGRCYRKCCKFRHMESRINRSSIPCYWENQPGGCRKPHCVFFHMKPRYNISSITENQGLILPVSSQPHSPVASIAVTDPVPDSVKMFSNHESNDSLALSPPSNPVPPVVVSFDEESDTESTTSTPVKPSSSEGKMLSVGKVLSLSTAQDSELREDRDLGIKTLEQIKMEKIHRESEHFYNTENTDDKNIDMRSIEQIRIEKLHRDSENFYGADYDTHMNEITLHEELPPDNSLYQGEAIYPTEPSDVLCQNADVYSLDENAPANSHDISVEDNLLSRDLRDILKQKRAGQQKQTDKDPPRKRIISLKRSFRQVEDESPAVTITFNEQQTSKDDSPAVKVLVKEPEAKDCLGFRIKTLEEIRKEKETKQDKINDSCEILTDSSSIQVKELSPSIGCGEPVSSDESKENSQTRTCKQISPKRKLKRRSMELYKPPAVLKNAEEPALSQEDGDTSQSFPERIPGKVVDKKPKADAENQMLHNESMNRVDQLKQVALPIKTDLNGDFKNVTSVGKRPFAAIDDLLIGKKSESLNASSEQQSTVIKNADQEVSAEHNGMKKLKTENDKNKSTQQRVIRPLIRRHVFQLKNIVPEDHLPALTNDKCFSMENDIPSIDAAKLHQSLEETNHQENLEPSPLSENITDNDNFSSGEQIVLAKREKRTSTISSVEDFDNLLLGGETDISLDEVEDNTDDKAEDILLELEQMLNS